MGLNINEMFPSKWLKAEDFAEGENKVLTIKDIKYQTLGQGAKAEDKPVVEFREDKPLVLNKTNAHVIAQLYGGDTDAWIGKRITAYTMDVDSFGDIVRAIRIRNAIPGEAAQSQAAQSQAAQSAVQASRSTPGGGQTAMPAPPQTGEPMVAANQKTLLVREAMRVWGEADYKAKAREQLGNIADLTHQNAEEWITWFKSQPDFKAAVADDYDDSDPFADD
jgi:hypothetical protein